MSTACASLINIDTIREELKKRVSPIVFKNWLESIRVESTSDRVLLILTDTEFHAERLKRDHLSLLKDLINKIYPNHFSDIRVCVVPQAQAAKTHPSTVEMPGISAASDSNISPRTPAQDKPPAPVIQISEFPPHSESNRLVVRVLEDFAHQPDHYDTIFLNGPAGCGKTTYAKFFHRCIKEIMHLHTLYITMDEFTSDLVQAIQGQSMGKFRTRFKEKYKAIIIDDFHLIAKRAKTQEELANLLPFWKNTGIKVIFISQLPIDQCATNEQLKMRLQSGLVLPVNPPDFICVESMVAKELQELGPQIRHFVIAECVKKVSSLHVLKGILNRIRIEAGLCQKTFDEKSIAAIVEEFLPQNNAAPRQDVSTTKIINLVCQYYQINRHDLSSKSRKKPLVESRKIIFYLLRKYSGLSLTDIGALLDRGHSTVLHALQKMDEERAYQSAFNKHVIFFEEKLASELPEDVPPASTPCALQKGRLFEIAADPELDVEDAHDDDAQAPSPPLMFH